MHLQQEQPLNMIRQIIHTNIEQKCGNTDFLIESKKFMKDVIQPTAFRIECPKNDRLSNIKYLEYYLKSKLKSLKRQTSDYNRHFKKKCFNCSSSFHGSSYKDGSLNLQKMFDFGKEGCVTDGVSLSLHIIEHAQPLKTRKCSEFHIECPKEHLSNIKDLQYYIKEKLEDLKLQAVKKSNFKIPCFNCSSSFHGSSYEDGHFNFQKIFAVREKCSNCQKNFTRERLFYHNCNICDASFNNCQTLANHRRKYHNSRQLYQCAACHLSIGDGALYRHIAKHKLPHICPYCSKRFAEKSYLKSHILGICKPNSEKEFKCKLCPMTFHSEFKLKGHQNLHAKRFTCKHCCKCFPSSITLQRHLHVHNEDWKHNCSFCNKGFLSRTSLESHMRSHTGEKPYSCKYCSKQYRDKCSLDNHLFEHTGVKQFKCDSCEKTFGKQHLLNQHTRIHIKKLFQCKYCPKQYKTVKSLNIHLCEHTGDKKFECDICGKKFARRCLLNQHKPTHIEMLFQCKYCSKQYKWKSKLNIHLCEHTGDKKFVCDICGKKFARRFLLNQHKFVHHKDNKVQCTICSKILKTPRSFESHKKLHTGRFKFQCKICYKQVANQYLLDNHTCEEFNENISFQVVSEKKYSKWNSNVKA